MTNYSNYSPPSVTSTERTSGRRLTRRSRDKVFAGVCGGVADHLGVDANIVRLILVAAVVLGMGSGIVLYAVGWWLMPEA